MAACVYPEGLSCASHPARRRRCREVGVIGALAASLMSMIILAPNFVHAKGPSLDFTWQVTSEAGNPSGEFTLTVILEPGWHLNANDPDRPYLIPTTLEIDLPPDTKVGHIRYPKAVVRTLAFAAGTPLRLYEGNFPIRVRLVGPPPSRFGARLSYQACNAETCLPPRTLAVPFDVKRSEKPK